MAAPPNVARAVIVVRRWNYDSEATLWTGFAILFARSISQKWFLRPRLCCTAYQLHTKTQMFRDKAQSRWFKNITAGWWQHCLWIQTMQGVLWVIKTVDKTGITQHRKPLSWMANRKSQAITPKVVKIKRCPPWSWKPWRVEGAVKAVQVKVTVKRYLSKSRCGRALLDCTHLFPFIPGTNQSSRRMQLSANARKVSRAPLRHRVIARSKSQICGVIGRVVLFFALISLFRYDNEVL